MIDSTQTNDPIVELNRKHDWMVNLLAKSGEDILSEMSSDQANLLHMAVGVSGESGELLDIIKKCVIYQKQLDMKHLIEELGDIEFYLAGVRLATGVTRNETLAANINKLSKRYEGFEYSNEAAQARADKQPEPTECPPK